ncbi:uncharacterized protein LOC131038893 [Cryptomeria japonica]|uniref:uncharacterized protein LOC131038893 n=1 Tax=Cryptomeria japonica TaxID=3369 RepID=UPI0027D9E0C7|nr:uncharacterized protein LOC131038893 [Cryptomeria japonica]
MVEVLGHLIARKRSQGMWKGIEIARGVDSTTHSQFVDDTCLFRVASMHEATVMEKVLDKFSWASGQEINWNKSEIFFFHTEVGSQRAIVRLFGIRIGQLPGKFLGMLLFVGAGKTKIWKGLLDGRKNGGLEEQMAHFGWSSSNAEDSCINYAYFPNGLF